MNLIVLLHLPNIACITSMDADHLDIYTSDAIKESFVEFANKVKDKVDYL
jgi:UDP-N-acetylmuramate--alanine ligase